MQSVKNLQKYIFFISFFPLKLFAMGSCSAFLNDWNIITPNWHTAMLLAGAGKTFQDQEHQQRTNQRRRATGLTVL